MKIILQINHEPFSFIKTYVQFLWSTNYVDMSSGCLVTFDEEKKHKLSLDHIWVTCIHPSLRNCLLKTLQSFLII